MKKIENKPRYSVITEHTDESIRRLATVQYNTFYKGAKLAYYLACFILIFIGLTFGGPAGIGCILAACFMVTGVNLPAKRNADKTIRSFKGHYPQTEYDFFDGELRFGSPGEAYDEMGIVEYSRFERFIEDADYLFLFVTKFGAYVIPKKKLADGEVEGIKGLISGACGKAFEKPGSRLGIRLKDLNS